MHRPGQILEQVLFYGSIRSWRKKNCRVTYQKMELNWTQSTQTTECNWLNPIEIQQIRALVLQKTPTQSKFMALKTKTPTKCWVLEVKICEEPKWWIWLHFGFYPWLRLFCCALTSQRHRRQCLTDFHFQKVQRLHIMLVRLPLSSLLRELNAFKTTPI